MSLSKDNSNDIYPRPDFARTSLNWLSLNGPWDFLFDDENTGLLQRWQQKGLPEHVAMSSVPEEGNSGAKAKTIMEKITGLQDKLLKDNKFVKQADGKVYKKTHIQVPFVFQTPASKIHELGAHEVFWYERTISDIRSAEEVQKHHRLLVRFGAVDYEATIWVEGHYVGAHRGGHVPFTVDVTDVIKINDVSRLTVRVRDSPYDLTQPRGKQYWAAKPESIFYTPSSGIWQTVWLESAPATRIADSSHGTILRSTDIDSGNTHAQVRIEGIRSFPGLEVELEASLGNILVSCTDRIALSKDSDVIQTALNLRLSQDQLQRLSKTGAFEHAPLDSKTCWRNGVALWSPDHPLLYDITIRLYEASERLVDEVKTTTGMRSLNWTNDDSSFRINDKPYFQALVLDQGYWPETGMTPPTPEHLKLDIELGKRMGFNGCRKHQKVEDPIFLYWADRLGYLVWGEMANGYNFNDTYAERFDQEWIEAVRRDMNHPCIITWTPINESWGYPALHVNQQQQDHIRSLYYMTKTLDPTRSINDNCGWQHVCTDLTTFHDYSDGPELAITCTTMHKILAEKSGRAIFVGGARPRENAPVLCTEFGGVNIAPRKGETVGDRDWGYTTASDPQDLLQRVRRLVMGVVEGGLVCGFVYTQLTDIEQEVNGLYSFDRREKLDAGKVKAIMEDAQKVYFDKMGGSEQRKT